MLNISVILCYITARFWASVSADNIHAACLYSLAFLCDYRHWLLVPKYILFKICSINDQYLAEL